MKAFTTITKKYLTSALTIGALSMGSAHAADTALIIGVGEYQNPKNNLPGIDLDMGMANEMAQKLGFNKANITHLSNQQATKANIKLALKKIANSTERNDRVFIYYSGHGAQVKDTTGDEPDNLDETLYVYDGHLLDDEINQALSKIDSDDMVVLLDACHSGTGTKSLAPNRYSSKSQRIKSKSVGYFDNITDKNLAVVPFDDKSVQKYVSIGAAQDDEQAGATLNGSLFTKSLHESLESARLDGSTSWKELYYSTKSKLDAMNMSAEDKFSPKLEGDSNLANKRIRLAKPGSNTNAGKVNWNNMLSTVNKLDKGVELDVADSINVGDLFEFDVKPSFDGYLYVVAVGADDKTTILYPNKYVSDNHVSTQRLTMPGDGKFKIRATEPLGDSMISVFLSKNKLNMEDKGFGFFDDNGSIGDHLFSQISGAGVHKSIFSKWAIEAGDSSTTTATPKPSVVANYAIITVKK